MRAEPERRAVRLVDKGSAEHLSVRALRAELTVDGPLLHSQLHITFSNELGRPVEGDLVFPLPPAAALRDLTVRCGPRTLNARIRPRERAQAEYARARAAGQTAALGESEGEDLLRVRIAPIDVGEDVVVSLQVVSLLLPTSEGHRLVLPLTYMPRYVEDEAALKDTERAAVNRPRPLTLAARAEVKVTVRHGQPEQRPTLRCTSHALRTEALHDEIVATLGPVALDRDLQIEINEPRSDGRTAGALPLLWLRHDPGPGPDGLGSATAMAVLPPAFSDEGTTTPRTVTLLVDRSGSMGGAPMESAIRAVRGCLRALQPTDRFNIIAFDDQLEALAPRPLPFNDEALTAADAFISGIGARGGTEASKAISAALRDDLPRGVHTAHKGGERASAAHRLRVVVFMTDGDVAGAEGVLQKAKAELADTRLHVIGIGESVQHALLAQLARLGGGTYTPVATTEDLEKALARLKAAIDAPLWTGVKVTLEADGKVLAPQHLEPEGRLDLFAGQPLLLSWRGGPEPGAALVSRWQSGGPYRDAPLAGEVRLRLTGQGPEGEDRKLHARLPAADARPEDAGGAMTLWALLRSQRLTYRYEATDDEALEALGVDFGLANRKVALVAVDSEQRDVQADDSVAVSLPMPRNLAHGALGAAAPSLSGMAMPMVTRAGTVSPVVMASMMAPPPMAQAPSGFMPPPAPKPMAPPMAQGYGGGKGMRKEEADEEVDDLFSAGAPAPAAEMAEMADLPAKDMDTVRSGARRSSAPPPSAAPQKAKKSIGAKLRSLFSSDKDDDAAPPAAPEPLEQEIQASLAAPAELAKTAEAKPAPVPSRPQVSKPAPAPAARAASAAPVVSGPSAGKAQSDPLPGARDDEATLRALLLRQKADGLFDADLGATLAAVAVLVGRGQTPREGLFRAELRRTAATLRKLLGEGLSGDALIQAALALALLTLPGGEAPPAALPAALASALTGLDLADQAGTRGRINTALRGAPGWQGSPLAQSLARAFHLG